MPERNDSKNKQEPKNAQEVMANKPQQKSYTVKEGDKFHEIATKYGLSVGKLKELNNDSMKIKAGKALNVEG